MRRGIDYIGVGVGAILVDEEGRLFLARRGPRRATSKACGNFQAGR